MLRALLERDITPDLVLGTSVGALNGALVARQPDLGVVDRLTELWQAASSGRKEVYGDNPLRTVRRAVAVRHPHLLRRAAAAAARGRARRRDLRGAAGPLRGVRGQHRAGRRALVHHRPGGRRGGRERRRTRAAAARQGRRRALPRRRHRELHPARPGRRARRRPGSSCSRSAGSTGRSAPPKRPWEVARVSFEIARRHRFSPRARRAARRRRVPRPPGPRHLGPRRHLLGTRDFSSVQERIDATYDASRAYLEEHL